MIRYLTLLILVFFLSNCNCRNEEKSNIGNYEGIAMIVGMTRIPSSLYLIFAISRREYEEYIKKQQQIYIGKRTVINIHLNQDLINSKLKNYYSKVSFIRSECGMGLLDENQRCAFVHVKLRNFNVYSENKRISHDVILYECTSYLLEHTDSSSISLVPLAQKR